MKADKVLNADVLAGIKKARLLIFFEENIPILVLVKKEWAT